MFVTVVAAIMAAVAVVAVAVFWYDRSRVRRAFVRRGRRSKAARRPWEAASSNEPPPDARPAEPAKVVVPAENRADREAESSEATPATELAAGGAARHRPDLGGDDDRGGTRTAPPRPRDPTPGGRGADDPPPPETDAPPSVAAVLEPLLRRAWTEHTSVALVAVGVVEPGSNARRDLRPLADEAVAAVLGTRQASAVVHEPDGGVLWIVLPGVLRMRATAVADRLTAADSALGGSEARSAIVSFPHDGITPARLVALCQHRLFAPGS